MKKLFILFGIILFCVKLTAPPLDWWTSYEVRESHNAVYEMRLYDRELDLYAHHLGWCESRNNWKVVNKQGYMGTWQHGTELLADLGFKITPDAFRADSSIFPPELQYKVLMAQIKVQTIQLRKFDAWIGHEVAGVVITRSGMLAATHLGGIGAVRDFLYYGIDRADSNGTRISDYLNEFSIYEL
ncbi:MAG TPA: hypothetical protein PLA73_10330 [Sedimentibacter sp.]|nr:hypothetical protein [Sedimentibacter sp.]